jgi:hypothetical protein
MEKLFPRQHLVGLLNDRSQSGPLSVQKLSEFTPKWDQRNTTVAVSTVLPPSFQLPPLLLEGMTSSAFDQHMLRAMGARHEAPATLNSKEPLQAADPSACIVDFSHNSRQHVHAAVVIQNCHRCLQARQLLLTVRHNRRALTVQRHFRGYRTRRDRYILMCIWGGAAMTIQCLTRKVLGLKNFALLKISKTSGATMFQKLFRGMKGRERFKLRRKVEYITKAADFKLKASSAFQNSDKSSKRFVISLFPTLD